MTTTADTTRYEQGLAKLAEVDSHQAGQQVVNSLGDLGRYIVEFGFGDIYSRPGMSLREREIATVALLTALGGRESQLRFHMEAALHVGITLQELEEIVLQTVPYAGFPTAINAMNVLAQFKGEETVGKGAIMDTTTPNTSRTAHLLALMKKGDDAFNARDFAAMDAIHHPDMIAHITGNAEPIYGRAAHAAMMGQMFRIFPDVHVYNDPYPIQFGGGDWITVVTRTTGTFTGEMTLPDGNVITPTGKAFDVEFVQTVKWDDDLLIEIAAFWDAALQAQQIGLA